MPILPKLPVAANFSRKLFSFSRNFLIEDDELAYFNLPKASIALILNSSLSDYNSSIKTRPKVVSAELPIIIIVCILKVLSLNNSDLDML